MRVSMRWAAAATAVAATIALAAPAAGHQTLVRGGVAVTMHVAPDDEPEAGEPALITVVKVKPPSGGSFTFKGGSCRIRIADSSGRVLLHRATGKRTTYTFPRAAAYEIAFSGRYRAKNGKRKPFKAAFAIRAHRDQQRRGQKT